MRYEEYVAWFDGEHKGLTFESGCTQVGPLFVPTPISKPPWKLDWCVRFSDGMHIKVKERWWPRPIKFGGRGYRKHFAFHYGEANPLSDADGFPLRDDKYRSIIRLDHDPYGPHLHFGGEDHVFQTRVSGFDISNADLFEFVRAVQLHRETGEMFDKILKFTVTA
jgi:hypothetical protein